MLPAVAAWSQSPFLGTPFAIPGKIEAEFFDLGGEGAGYHFSGNSVTHEIFGYSHTAWRPEEGIASAGWDSTHVVLQTSEWLNYTVNCTRTGAYSLQLKTAGPPQAYVDSGAGEFDPIYRFQPTVATLHLELDGNDVTGPMQVRTNMVSPRVHIPEGRHTLRVVLDHAQDARDFDVGYQGGIVQVWPRFAIPVDWIQVVPAAPAMRRTLVAGGSTGFRDGVGAAARLGGTVVFLGQRSTGELVLWDRWNAAIRLLSSEGEVRSFAGFPGNAVTDGVGIFAGFGEILDVLLLPNDSLMLVDREGTGPERVRRISPDGEVTTLYWGWPEVTVPDFSPGQYEGQMTNRQVALRRVVMTESGDLSVVGALADHWLHIGPGPMQWPSWIPYTRHVWFQFSEGGLNVTQLAGPPPPAAEPSRFGQGYRRDPETRRLVAEGVPGFFQEILPEVTPESVFLTREGILHATLHPATVVRLDPDPTLSSLRVHVTGDGAGMVSGVPNHFVGPDEDAVLTATPQGRFVVFSGWSDGVTDNPRTVRTPHDLQLTARFETRLPSPIGVLPGTVHMGADGFPRFALVGAALPYLYRIERSTNLIHWSTADGVIGSLNASVSGAPDSLVVYRAESWISLRLRRPAPREYFRAVLLPR